MLVDISVLQEQLKQCKQSVKTEDYDTSTKEVIELERLLKQFFKQLPAETTQSQQPLSEIETRFMKEVVDFIQSHTLKFSDISDDIKTQITAINNKSKVKQAYQG